MTCGLTDQVGDVEHQIARSPYRFALVVDRTGVVLGRLPSSALNVAPDTPVEQRMESGPSTVRPHISAEKAAQRLRDKGLQTAIVTTPEGRLIGVTQRDELEQPSS